MADRSFRALTVWLVVGLATATGAWSGLDHWTRVPRPGGPAPAILAGSGRVPIVVTWVMRDEDCFSCQSAAPGLRRIIADFDSAVDLHVVAVGTGEEVRRQVVRERLRATVSVLPRWRERWELGAATLPVVYLTIRDTLIGSWGQQRAGASVTEGTLYHVIQARLSGLGDRSATVLPERSPAPATGGITGNAGTR